MFQKFVSEIDMAVGAAFEDCLLLGGNLDQRIRLHSNDEIVIETYTTRDSGRMSNGGEYTYYVCVRLTEYGVYVYPDWSADFDRIQWLGEGKTYPYEDLDFSTASSQKERFAKLEELVRGCARRPTQRRRDEMNANEILQIRAYMASNGRHAGEAAREAVRAIQPHGYIDGQPFEQVERDRAFRAAYNAAAWAAEQVLVENGVGETADWRDFPGYSPVSWGKYSR